jgi:hypothetical protein
MYGPTGPTGPAGAIGPQGITGQYGVEGWRGFPGRPVKPIQVQILQCLSDNVLMYGQQYDFPINAAVPALSGNNSTSISGFSVTPISNGTGGSIGAVAGFGGPTGGYFSDIKLPSGTYFIEAFAAVSRNVLDATSNGATPGLCYLSLYDLCGNSNALQGSPTVAPNTGYLTGYLSKNAASHYSLRQTVVDVPSGSNGQGANDPLRPGLPRGPGTLLSTEYNASNYGNGVSPAPTIPPTNVNLTIMKFA